MVRQGGNELRGGGGDANDAGGEPGLWGDGDLGAAGAGGVEDLVGGVLGGRGDTGSGGAHGEPGELLFGLPGEFSLDAGAGAHEARADGSDANTLLAKLGVEAFGEAGKGELAGHVRKQVRDGDLAADGGNVDYGGFAAVDFLLREHAWERRLDGVEGAVEVGIHGSVKGVEGLVFEGADLDNAGVVDEDIDSTEVNVGLIDQVLDLCGVGEICRNEEDIFAGADRARIEKSMTSAVQFGRIAGRQDEAIAGLSEAMCEREAKAAGAAGDDHDLPRRT